MKRELAACTATVFDGDWLATALVIIQQLNNSRTRPVSAKVAQERMSKQQQQRQLSILCYILIIQSTAAIFLCVCVYNICVNSKYIMETTVEHGHEIHHSSAPGLIHPSV